MIDREREPVAILRRHGQAVDTESGEVLDDAGDLLHECSLRAVVIAQQRQIEQLEAENTRLRTAAAERSVEADRDERVRTLSARVGELTQEVECVCPSSPRRR